MRYQLAEDARPQFQTLLIATLVSVFLWFVPFAEWLVYPLRLFVTFVHEGGHALTAFLLGSSVQSLSVEADGSGLVMARNVGWFGTLLFSSAGYLGAVAYGTLLLVLIRKAWSARILLVSSAVFVAAMTFFFGFVSPVLNVFSLNIGLSSVAFTIASGILLTLGLLAVAKYAPPKWINFSVAFLAVQCILNAFSDLKTLFFINSPLNNIEMHTDAANMAAATGIPPIVWVFFWIFISLLLLSVGLRVYAVRQSQPKQYDLPFEDKSSF